MNRLPLDRADEFIPLLRDRLSKKTFKHTISVAHLMNRLADRWDLPRDAAITAGLLHDYCKPMKNKALLQAAENYRIPIMPLCLERPTLLHGPVAAEEIRRTLNIHDDDVYEAVYHHTFGKPGMGVVALALYVADFAEELRENPEAAVARGLIETKGLYATLRYVADAKLDIVRRKGRLVDDASLAFRAWVLETFAP